MSRHDNVGFFWEDAERVSARGTKKEKERAIPDIPDTGWRPPTEFPNLAAATRIALDCETYDPDLLELGPGPRRDGRIVGLAVGVEDGGRWYFPMRHELGTEYNLDPDQVLRWAKDELGREHQPKVGANISYDVDFLSYEGVIVRGDLLDVQIAEPLIDENALSYTLDVLARKYLKEKKVDDLLYRWSHMAYGGPEGRRQAANIYRCPPQLVGPYAEGDVDLPLRILREQEKVISEQSLTDIFRIETRIQPLLIAMRQRGVRIDLEAANHAHEMLDKRIKESQKTLGIDVYSASDLERFCKKRGIAYLKTALGNASFTADWLEASPDPSLQQVVAIRKMTKARDVFLKSYILDKNLNGRLHCQFNAMKSDDSGTVSGRFSSSNPNLQNIPNRDPVIGPMIRALFVPDDNDQVWARWDQSQIEYRFLCHYGSGPGASQARALYYSDPKTDFHRMVADLTGLERGPAKNINFGLCYGMSDATMAGHLGRPLEDVIPMFNQYHERLPFVRHTYNAVSRVAEQRGYIVTVLGRRRRFDSWEVRIKLAGKMVSKYFPSREEAEKHGRARRAHTHKALNALLQGSAADQMKKSMLDLWESGICNEIGAPGLTVHDEIDWSIPRDCKKYLSQVKEIMEESIALRVPVRADVGFGENWQEAK